MILAEPAAYLECQYDRAQALRVIAARLHHQLHTTGYGDPAQRARLRARIGRVHRHLTILAGDAA